MSTQTPNQWSRKGFYFDVGRCIKCHACEIACLLWNVDAQRAHWRTVDKVGAGAYPDVKQINVSLTCMHCGIAPCIESCPVRAISKGSSGIVRVDVNKCIGCGFCLWACPFGAPKLDSDGKMRKCNFCCDRPEDMPKACEEVCPTAAIVSGEMQDLSKLASERVAQRLLGAQTVTPFTSP